MPSGASKDTGDNVTVSGGTGASVTLKAGPSTPTTPSPAAAEAGRLRKADAAMLRFCSDLNSLVGRIMVSPEMRNQDMDALTAEIYAAAIEAGLDYNAVLAGDSPLDTPTWMNNAARVLAKLRRNVPESTYHRVLEVWTGTKEDAHEDPDAKHSLDYAEGYFDTGKPEVDTLVDLASCLLDYAFTRQGLDDELVRQAKKKPEELQKALVAAGGGKEETPDPATPPSNKDELLDQYNWQPFVKSVKEALLDWKGSLFDAVAELNPTSIYRIAMVHAGLPTGDALAQKCYSGTIRHRHAHPNRLVTIGHAALALNTLSKERGIDTSHVSYELVTEFCRTCGNFLEVKKHGCCYADVTKQANEIKYLHHLADFESDRKYGFGLYTPRVGDESITKEKDYLLRVTTLEEGESKYEVHVQELWDAGIWQEVKDRAAGERLAKRVMAEHKKAKALAKREAPTSVVIPQTSTDQVGDLMHLGGEMNNSVETLRFNHAAEMLKGLTLQEYQSQRNLGRAIRWLGTIVCAGAFLVTGKIVFIPMVMVAWVMAYALIDKKAIDRQKAQFALNPALNPGKDTLRADVDQELFVKTTPEESRGPGEP